MCKVYCVSYNDNCTIFLYVVIVYFWSIFLKNYEELLYYSLLFLKLKIDYSSRLHIFRERTDNTRIIIIIIIMVSIPQCNTHMDDGRWPLHCKYLKLKNIYIRRSFDRQTYTWQRRRRQNYHRPLLLPDRKIVLCETKRSGSKPLPTVVVVVINLISSAGRSTERRFCN